MHVAHAHQSSYEPKIFGLNCTYVNLFSKATSIKHPYLRCFGMPQPKRLIFTVFPRFQPRFTTHWFSNSFEHGLAFQALKIQLNFTYFNLSKNNYFNKTLLVAIWFARCNPKRWYLQFFATPQKHWYLQCFDAVRAQNHCK